MVSTFTRHKRSMVTVTKDGIQQYVGSFLTQEEALSARDTFMRGEEVIKRHVVYRNEPHGFDSSST
jgi:hypothetical protein